MDLIDIEEVKIDNEPLMIINLIHLGVTIILLAISISISLINLINIIYIHINPIHNKTSTAINKILTDSIILFYFYFFIITFLFSTINLFNTIIYMFCKFI